MPSLFARALGGFLLLALLVPGALADQPEVGRVVGVAGQCMIQRSGRLLQLSLNSAIDVGDVIGIPADGKVKLRMNDGSILSLAPQTNLTVTAYTVNPQGQHQNVGLTLGAGLLRAVVALGQQPSTFEVKTATGTAAVRSTDWFIEVNSGGTGVAVLRGSVDLKTAAASGGEVLINARQSSSITAGSNPTPPEAMSMAAFNALISQVEIVVPRASGPSRRGREYTEPSEPGGYGPSPGEYEPAPGPGPTTPGTYTPPNYSGPGTGFPPESGGPNPSGPYGGGPGSEPAGPGPGPVAPAPPLVEPRISQPGFGFRGR
jgi:hypothetical protein